MSIASWTRVAVICVLGFLTWSQAGADGIDVTFSIRKSQFMLGEPIIIDCQITNSSQTVFEFATEDRPHVSNSLVQQPPLVLQFVTNDRPHVSNAFRFVGISGDVRFYMVNRLTRSDDRFATGIIGLNTVRIQPGEAHTEILVLNQWLTPTQLGRCEIECWFTTQDYGYFQILSFDVVATDPAKLCAWVRAAVTAVQDNRTSVMERDVLNQAIGFVGSPAAIPELRWAAERGVYTAFEALHRMPRNGRDEATKTLVELSKSADTNLAARALWFLGW